MTLTELLPTHLKFIKDHVGADMTVLEISRYLKCDPALIHKTMDAHRACDHHFPHHGRPIALHSPYAPVIGMNVRKATILDKYAPMAHHDWQEILEARDAK